MSEERQTATFRQMSLRKDILLAAEFSWRNENCPYVRTIGGSGTLELLARVNNFP